MKVLALIFLFQVLPVKYSTACMCHLPKSITQEDVNRSDMIFVGEVLKIEASNKHRFPTFTITFKVLQSLKLHPDSIEVNVITYKEPSLCGLEFKVGEKWYINTEGNQMASLCGRSARIAKPYLRKSHAYTQKQYRAIINDQKRVQRRIKDDIKFILALQAKQG